MFGWSRYVGYFISCWITTIIALEICYCVVSPFKVKQVCTKLRCIAVILLIYLLHVGVLIPIYIYGRMHWLAYTLGGKDQNGTLIYYSQLQCMYTLAGAQWDTLVNMVEGIALSLLSQGLIILSTFWMVNSLTKSSKIRKSKRKQEKGEKSENTGTLSSRERRLVKVIILLAIIQTACNIPRFVVTAVYHLFPCFLIGGYLNLNYLMWELSHIFSTVCCTRNILVYLKINANFRYKFHLMFSY